MTEPLFVEVQTIQIDGAKVYGGWVQVSNLVPVGTPGVEREIRSVLAGQASDTIQRLDPSVRERLGPVEYVRITGWSEALHPDCTAYGWRVIVQEETP